MKDLINLKLCCKKTGLNLMNGNNYRLIFKFRGGKLLKDDSNTEYDKVLSLWLEDKKPKGSDSIDIAP